MITFARWTARILGTLSVLFFLALVFGEGPPNPFKLTAAENLTFLCMIFLFLGLILAWFREGLGGGVTLAAFAALVLVSRTYLHMPALQIPAAIGALHVICWARLRNRPDAAIPRGIAITASVVMGLFLLLCANEIFGNPPLMTPSLRPGPALAGTWQSGDHILIIHSDSSVTGMVTGAICGNRSWFGKLMHWRTDYLIQGAGPFELRDSELRGMGRKFRRIQ